MQRPEETFGEAVTKGAMWGGGIGLALGAEGNPLLSTPIGVGLGAAYQGIKHIVQSVSAANDDARYHKAAAERRARLAEHHAAQAEAREASLSSQLKNKNK